MIGPGRPGAVAATGSVPTSRGQWSSVSPSHFRVPVSAFCGVGAALSWTEAAREPGHPLEEWPRLCPTGLDATHKGVKASLSPNLHPSPLPASTPRRQEQKRGKRARSTGEKRRKPWQGSLYKTHGQGPLSGAQPRQGARPTELPPSPVV